MSAPRSDQPSAEQRASQEFLTTHWSIVAAAGQKHSDATRAALTHLCDTYWYPLYCFVRHRGFDAHDAQDLTQGFFAQLLEKDTLRLADRERGRFRSFLLASLTHFLANEWRRQSAEKRGGGHRPLPLDFDSAEDRLKREPIDDATPQRHFERRWALTVLEKAMARLQRQFESKGQLELFDALVPALDGGGQPYVELAARLSMTEAAIKVAVHRLRKDYRACLRDEIAQTVADPADVDAELDQLLQALRGVG